MGRSLVRHESVGHIVHQRRHCHRVDRFEVEDHPGLEIVQHLGIGLVQMGGGLSSVHMPITLLEDQRPRHIATFWREPPSGTDADNSPGPDRTGCRRVALSAIRQQFGLNS